MYPSTLFPFEIQLDKLRQLHQNCIRMNIRKINYGFFVFGVIGWSAAVSIPDVRPLLQQIVKNYLALTPHLILLVFSTLVIITANLLDVPIFTAPHLCGVISMLNVPVYLGE
jgi:hypothetical protein